MPASVPAGDSAPELLNIREAAALLKVSEVSLRRWTNQGKLPCLRVGGRKERRFRRADLLKFADTGADGGVTAHQPVMIEDMAVARGDHLCSFYKTELGRIKLAVSFLAGGLEAGEFCILIAGEAAGQHIREKVQTVYHGLAVAETAGQWRMSAGAASGGEMFDQLEKAFVDALHRGFGAMRLVGDMAWALEQGVAAGDLMDFERRYNHDLANRYPVVSLCQYDTRLFAGEVVHEALVCHEDTFSYRLSRFV